MLTLISATRFELLEDRLLESLMQPDGDPFAAATVLVPSAAIRQRLALAVADRHGVCAQIEFAFLAQWLWRQIGALLPDVAERSPYDPATLRWRIDACLATLAHERAHPRLAGWLAGADAAMRFALADRLAGLFDQYLTYRPDWLAAWSGGGVRATAAEDVDGRADELWQAALWRMVEAGLAAPQGSSRAPVQDFLAALARGVTPAGLPGVVRVFCVPAMPPLYLELLCGLSRRVEIELFVLNPCREFWFDLASQREHARRVVRGDAAHLEVGHRLLSAWGRQTQTWLALLLARDEGFDLHELDPPDPAPAQAPASLLARLQDGVHALHDPAPGTLADLAGPDASLQIHCCHSLLRELEVLHDCLLTRLAGAGAPAPHEILVVVPDLLAAAPLIEQVFGTAPRPLALPWSITGLPATAANPMARALLAVLEFASGRMPLSGLLAVLQEPPVAARFGLADGALEDLAGLLRDADVHWGLDAGHRATLGLPATERSSLRDGLERLWLHFALPEGAQQPWQARLPAAGSYPDPDLLNSLHEFLAGIDTLRQRLAQPLAPADWLDLLEATMVGFLDDARGWLAARAALRADLRAHALEFADAGVAGALEVPVLLQALRERLQGGASGGVPGGAVTFAALPSLRSLPYRMVCVLGLDDGVFPAAARPLEFDLIARSPRAGDRQRHDDDRNLFLDLLLAARDGLYLSYSGRSARDNAERPPSVLVADLVDTLAAALCPAGADGRERERMRARLVCQHPLQPFDQAYFDGSVDRLPRSHRADLAAALRARAAAVPALLSTPGGSAADAGDDDLEAADIDDASLTSASQSPFLAVPLAPPGPEWQVVEVERLARFLQHPGRTLLRERLGLRLPEREIDGLDDEAFLPPWPAPEALARRLLPLLLAAPDSDAAALRALATAAADFPQGP
ncbi:MAG: exodeoxyribonuclease V subunit gamma, partial [Pseudomonadota bacterium]|nr:exodeoxyribonuclease V subunit gamma [Pseudomonadota bacterium]